MYWMNEWINEWFYSGGIAHTHTHTQSLCFLPFCYGSFIFPPLGCPKTIICLHCFFKCLHQQLQTPGLSAVTVPPRVYPNINDPFCSFPTELVCFVILLNTELQAATSNGLDLAGNMKPVCYPGCKIKLSLVVVLGLISKWTKGIGSWGKMEITCSLKF